MYSFMTSFSVLQAACDCTAHPGVLLFFSPVCADILLRHNCRGRCCSELSAAVQVSVQTGSLVPSAPFVRLMWIVFFLWRVSGQRVNNAEGELCFKLGDGWHLQLFGACRSRRLCEVSPSERATWDTSPLLRPHLEEKAESFSQ